MLVLTVTVDVFYGSALFHHVYVSLFFFFTPFSCVGTKICFAG